MKVHTVSSFFCFIVPPYNRSQWPNCLRRGSAAARLLGLRVRIPPEYGCLSFVSVVCCQVGVSATGRSLVQRRPTKCCVSVCDRDASIPRRPWPTKSSCAVEKQKNPYMFQSHWIIHYKHRFSPNTSLILFQFLSYMFRSYTRIIVRLRIKTARER
jgi:hypothetical protein